MITSVNNPLIKTIRKYRQKKYRTKEQRFLVEGVHLVEEALVANVDVDMLVKDENAPLLSVDVSAHRVVDVKASVFATLSDTDSPQGWLAVCKLPSETEDTIKEGNVVLLDGVRDPGNLGTIIRTAEAAGMAGVYVSDDTVDLYNAKVIRATQGALFYLPVIVADLKKVVFSLQKEGIIIYGTDMHSERSYREVRPYGSYALLLGNEARGIAPELLSLTNKTVSVPILGSAESLNVAVAAGIIMYDWIH